MLGGHAPFKRSRIHVCGPARSEFTEAVESLLNGVLPENWEWFKNSSSSLVARRLKPTMVYYKEFLSRSPLETVKSVFRGTRCHRARLQSEILGRKGFRSPTILCWGDKGQRQFMISAGVAALGVANYIEVHWHRPLSGEKLRAKRRLIRDLGREIGRLHQSGIFHGDLRPNNVLVEERDGKHLFHFIDTERNRSYNRVPKRLIKKNLVQLSLIFPTHLTLQDRVRFFNAYCTAHPRYDTQQRRALMREIHTRTQQRLAKIANKRGVGSPQVRHRG